MPPVPTPILRFTHVDNLDTIIRLGGLHAPNHIPGHSSPYRPCHGPQVHGARASVQIPVGPRGTIHDYVPFYFGYLSPMMLQLKTGQVPGYNEGQEPLIYLVSTAQSIASAGLSFVFSNGHGLATFLTDWFDDLTQLVEVDWSMVYQSYWRDEIDDPDRQRRKQAEFLVYQCCPWSLIQEIVVINAAMQQRVEAILATFPAAQRRVVTVKQNWYY